jgi:hypothetical protein
MDEASERGAPTTRRPGLVEALLDRRDWAPLVLGIGLGFASIVVYAAAGYSRAVLLLWLAGLATLALYFRARSAALPRVAALDVAVSVGLVAAFVPLYLIGVYSRPVQVNSDEVAIMTFAERHATEHGVDLFGLSTYLGHPKMLFVFLGKLGGLLGGVDLGNMRLVHGAFGLLAIAGAYVLLRQLLPRWWAVFGVCILGLNHSLFMLSRMAMRENTVVLVEVIALALLVVGLRHDHAFLTFLGGIAAGLGFYVYFPARAIFVVWLLFLGGLALWFRKAIPARRIARLGAIAAVGAVLTAGPVVVAGLQAPPEINEQQRLALLVFPEAREIQQNWSFSASTTEGIKKNISYGLTAFNSDRSDNAFNYPNYGHGFVDPMTGLLLWIGAGVVLVGLLRRRTEPWALLGLGGFVVVWLALAFLVNKAPNYPRMLITLPFVAYLVAVAARAIVEPLRARLAETKPLRGSAAAAGLAVLAVGIVGAWNLSIAWDFVSLGRRTGDDIGSTGRYIDAHRGGGKRFYLAASDVYPYYQWGYPQIWQERMLIFTENDSDIGGIVEPSALREFSAAPPFALFLSRQLFSQNERDLQNRYTNGRLRNVTADGRRVVFEVPKS